MRRLSKILSSGFHVDWFLGKVSHLTKYSTFPFLFRCFRVFSALNTVSLSIKIAFGVDSFALWSWFFVFSPSNSLFDSFSSWDCGVTYACLPTGFNRMSKGILPHAQNYLAQKNLLEYQIHLNMARKDHQKAEGQLASNLDQQTASYDLRDTKKQLFYWRPCAT